MMTARYQVRKTKYGEYQIQRSMHGAPFKDLWDRYSDDDSYCYWWLWMAKFKIFRMIRHEKAMFKHAAEENSIVYGPVPKKKIKVQYKGPSM